MRLTRSGVRSIGGATNQWTNNNQFADVIQCNDICGLRQPWLDSHSSLSACFTAR